MGAPIKTQRTPPEANDGTQTGSAAPAPAERDLERALGSQIRAIRRQQDLSVSDLASAAGISNGMLSKIENGGISASLATLQAISSVLQVSLSSLFASSAAAPRSGTSMSCSATCCAATSSLSPI
jgi:DNA-binding XRE family transcriptional regulator